jgi:hypothetical protein
MLEEIIEAIRQGVAMQGLLASDPQVLEKTRANMLRNAAYFLDDLP